jgi:hypothetical protein
MKFDRQPFYQSDDRWTNACYEEGVTPPTPTKRETTKTPPPPPTPPFPISEVKIIPKVPAQRPSSLKLWKPNAPTPD